MLKLSAKLKKNNSRKFSSKKTTFWDKGCAEIFVELPVFGQRLNHRSQCDMPALGPQVENSKLWFLGILYFLLK